MATDLEFCAIVLLWAICVYRLPYMLRSPQQGAFTLMLLAVTASATINEHPVTTVIDRITGVADVSVLLKNLLGLLAAMAALRFADAIAVDEEPGERRRRIGGYVAMAAAMIAMIALFTIIPRQQGGPDFVDAQAANPAAGAYGVIFQLCLGATLVWVSRGYWRYWGNTRSGALRTTLLLFSLGLAVGVLYVLNRLVFLLSHLLGSRLIQGPGYVAVSTTLFASALLLIGVGSVAYVFRAGGHQLGRYLSLHRMYPLWHTLVQAAPEVVLGPTPTRTRDLLAVRGLRLRLYRRTIEIRDAQWILRDHVSARARADLRQAVTALGLADDLVPTVTEACLLEIGRRAKLAGRPPNGALAETAFATGVDLDSEVRDLLRIARRSRSPMVARLVDGLPTATLRHATQRE
ncbi:MAG TPA: MAB_1171c family putative transporter [Pseudonocardiaceae bacterium]|jgi:hypothetical protein|nr:MAB_1171c family putative transporter [Pseudonocardiaceae bacterium]